MSYFPSLRTPLRLAVVVILFGMAGVGLSGCFTVETGIGSASDAAGEAVGEAIGERIVSSANLPQAGTTQWNQFMVTQAQLMFQYAFSASGMWPAEASYEPGEWTKYRFQIEGEEDGGFDSLERAFLKRTEDGQEWWRVRAVQGDETWVYEALISPEQEEVVRLRSRDPEGNVGEVPVTEKTVYRSPQRLTEESVEGATTGTKDVETPAGTFTARQVEYTGGMGGGTVTWFLSNDVPGHVVKYEVSGTDGRPWVGTLMEYGSDASTILDSY